jgi:hypothetical protein
MKPIARMTQAPSRKAASFLERTCLRSGSTLGVSIPGTPCRASTSLVWRSCYDSHGDTAPASIRASFLPAGLVSSVLFLFFDIVERFTYGCVGLRPRQSNAPCKSPAFSGWRSIVGGSLLASESNAPQELGCRQIDSRSSRRHLHST